MRHRPLFLFTALLTGAWLTACSATRLATPGGEAKLGSELAQQVEATVGLLKDPALTAYLGSVGARLIAASDSVRGVEYRFRLLDLEAPNAFALPGGHIYISRGLLALLQTEDELANVLAHEIAHVSARHHLRHAVRDTPFVPVRIATGIGSLASGIVSPLLGKAIATLGNAPGALVLASYSRGQEDDADALGQGYAAAAGWDPLAMSRVMEALGGDAARRGTDPNRHSYFATHPTAPDRAQKTAARAQAFYVKDGPASARNRRDFLRRLEGLHVGSSARDGVIAGSEYLHPQLDFHLTFPEGWQVVQDDHSVRAIAAEKDAMILVTLAGEGDDPEPIAKRVIHEIDFEIEQGPTTRWGDGRIATFATARYQNGGKQYRYALAWIAHGGRVYQISAGAYLQTWESRKAELESVAPGFRTLEAGDAPKIREGRLRVVSGQGRLLEEFMPADGAWSIEETTVANALDGPASSDLDGWYKIAPLERYAAPAPPR